MDEEVRGRVAFGDGETDHLPAEWAEGVLRKLFDRHRGTFGALLAEVVTGQQFKAVRQR